MSMATDGSKQGTLRLENSDNFFLHIYRRTGTHAQNRKFSNHGFVYSSWIGGMTQQAFSLIRHSLVAMNSRADGSFLPGLGFHLGVPLLLFQRYFSFALLQLKAKKQRLEQKLHLITASEKAKLRPIKWALLDGIPSSDDVTKPASLLEEFVRVLEGA